MTTIERTPTPTTDRAAVSRYIRAFADTGWTIVSVHDGDDETEGPTPREAIETVMGVDECRVYVEKGPVRGWLYFVLGNEPYEVLCDYTVNLADVVDAVDAGWDD